MRRPLIMARGKSLLGPFFGKISGNRLMHTAGNFLGKDDGEPPVETLVFHEGEQVTHEGEDVMHVG